MGAEARSFAVQDLDAEVMRLQEAMEARLFEMKQLQAWSKCSGNVVPDIIIRLMALIERERRKAGDYGKAKLNYMYCKRILSLEFTEFTFNLHKPRIKEILQELAEIADEEERKARQGDTIVEETESDLSTFTTPTVGSTPAPGFGNPGTATGGRPASAAIPRDSMLSNRLGAERGSRAASEAAAPSRAAMGLPRSRSGETAAAAAAAAQGGGAISGMGSSSRTKSNGSGTSDWSDTVTDNDASDAAAGGALPSVRPGALSEVGEVDEEEVGVVERRGAHVPLTMDERRAAAEARAAAVGRGSTIDGEGVDALRDTIAKGVLAMKQAASGKSMEGEDAGEMKRADSVVVMNPLAGRASSRRKLGGGGGSRRRVSVTSSDVDEDFALCLRSPMRWTRFHEYLTELEVEENLLFWHEVRDMCLTWLTRVGGLYIGGRAETRGGGWKTVDGVCAWGLVRGRYGYG
jgi:hypothetical protein